MTTNAEVSSPPLEKLRRAVHDISLGPDLLDPIIDAAMVERARMRDALDRIYSVAMNATADGWLTDAQHIALISLALEGLGKRGAAPSAAATVIEAFTRMRDLLEKTHCLACMHPHGGAPCHCENDE